MHTALRLHEIFAGIYGESFGCAGATTIVRVASSHVEVEGGKVLTEAWKGEILTSEELLQRILKIGHTQVAITGQEPLSYAAILGILENLVQRGFLVFLETEGLYSLAKVPPTVRKLLRIRAKNTRLDTANLQYLHATDQVHFTAQNAEELEWIEAFVREQKLLDCCTVFVEGPKAHPGLFESSKGF